MTNLPQPPTWLAIAPLPPWFTGLVLAAAVGALLLLVRRWRKGARARVLDARPALWPADIPTYRRSFAVLSAEIARVPGNGRSLAVLILSHGSRGHSRLAIG